ncbi:MAG: UbiD family decarboxylase [Gammaproteobacteria bacterium]|jgi:UbiD family decarboxylase|nr:UbiD family decarboxylase [Gammaproteobacteria bacterium]MDP6695755.1 UbiD family decarboxylase [Gammaproteobacteria bacterium]
MDFRSLLELLDKRGDLLRIAREVDPKYELGTLLAQAEKRGKAILFEKVRGADYPASGGALLTRGRHALGIDRPEDYLAERDSYRKLLQNAWDSPLDPETVDRGPVNDVILTGDDIDVTRLPVPWFFKGDTHPFITAGLGLADDPDTGFQNLGFYRTPIIDARTISVGASGISNLRRIYDKVKEKSDRMPIALAIGAPPAMYITAASRVHEGVSDLQTASAIQQSPVELVKCQTSNLMVPARAEFVLEAEVDFTQDLSHVMGEYGDSYGENTTPIAHVTAITHRKDPVFQVINGGMTPEHNNLGVILFSHLRLELLDHLRGSFPFVEDVHMHSYPPHGGARSRVTVAIDKSDDGQPQQVIDAVYGYKSGRFPMVVLLQRVVVVDKDVDLTNAYDVEWAIASRMSSADSIEAVESNGMLREGKSIRLRIDATVPMDMQAGSTRPTFADAGKYNLDQYI